MSVNQRHYVMIGIDLLPRYSRMNDDEKDVFIQRIEELAEDMGLEFILDGMSEEYCFIGHVLNEGEEAEGMSPKIHHFASDLNEIRRDVAGKISSISFTEPSLLSFTHWY